jgi:hypothetical protein
MAETTLLVLSAPCWTGDADAQLVGGDGDAVPVRHKGRMAWAFDDTAEEAIVSAEVEMPAGYAGTGTLKARIHFAMESDATNDIALDVFVEAKTPNTDTLDMESATSWDSANSATVSVGGTTAGDPLTLTVTLTNDDGVAAGDLVRFGIRRDCDSGDDDASDDLFIYSVTIFEDI